MTGEGLDLTVIGSRPTAPPLITPNALSPPTDIDLNHLLSKLVWEYITLSTPLRDYLEGIMVPVKLWVFTADKWIDGAKHISLLRYYCCFRANDWMNSSKQANEANKSGCADFVLSVVCLWYCALWMLIPPSRNVLGALGFPQRVE